MQPFKMMELKQSTCSRVMSVITYWEKNACSTRVFFYISLIFVIKEIILYVNAKETFERQFTQANSIPLAIF